MELTLDQFERLSEKLDGILAEQGESRTESALIRQEMTQIREHLARLNGRVGKSEERLTAIEMTAIEARGAWKAAVAVASIVGGLASWILQAVAGGQSK